jgi:hypothetical protein
MARFQFAVLIAACVQSTLITADRDSPSCVESRAEFDAALALVSSLETQIEQARQNVVAKGLQVRSCAFEDNTNATDSEPGSGAARRSDEHDEFSCISAKWKSHNAIIKCSTFGDKSNAIEVADAGGWTHAYQEISVDSDATYTISGEFFGLAIGECDGSAAVKWCSPSVVVCPGSYNGDYYNTGGCLVGLAPNGKDAWEPFKTTFTATSSTVTVYINQESTTYSSVVDNLRIKLLQECLSMHAPFASLFVTGYGRDGWAW